ncbi:helix-turn-helix domain-containing protein [Lacticaseibacillus suihuaensis]
MKFATQVRTYRQERGWSQEALAQQLFLTRQTISKWEQGDATPDLETLVRLATLFNVSLDRLVLGQDAAASGADAGHHPETNATVPPQPGRTAYDWLEENSVYFIMLSMAIVIWVFSSLIG